MEQFRDTLLGIGLENVDSIIISAYASPEGVVEHNVVLARRRGASTEKYLKHHYPELASRLIVRPEGESWSALRRCIIQDNRISDSSKERLLRIIDNPSISVGTRKWRLERDSLYKYLYRTHYSSLRNSLLFIVYISHSVKRDTTLCASAERAVLLPGIAKPTATDKLAVANIGMQQHAAQLPVTPTAPRRPFYMSIKTNMLYDLALTPNLGVEFYLGKNFSIAADWMYAWWKSDARQWYWRVYGGDLALRKWLGRKAAQKPLTGHHIGVYAQALTYDFLWNDKGTIAGIPGGDIFDSAHCAVGIEYGYSMPVGRRLNIDFTLGVGYMWGKYYEYTPIDDCYVWQATKKRKWIGPTKAEISLVWLIGRNNVNAKKGGRR